MDAWVLGAVDPGSGTGVMIEIARAFGSLKEKLSMSLCYLILLINVR